MGGWRGTGDGDCRGNGCALGEMEVRRESEIKIKAVWFEAVNLSPHRGSQPRTISNRTQFQRAPRRTSLVNLWGGRPIEVQPTSTVGRTSLTASSSVLGFGGPEYVDSGRGGGGGHIILKSPAPPKNTSDICFTAQTGLQKRGKIKHKRQPEREATADNAMQSKAPCLKRSAPRPPAVFCSRLHLACRLQSCTHRCVRCGRRAA